MHTQPVLRKFFRSAFPALHATRLEALAAAVNAVCQGARVSITAMGRGLNSPVRIKHRVKRMNRLVGNRLLGGERERFYRALALRLLANAAHPVIVMDWSDFSADRRQQLLRASLPVGGRAITLYEELHPYEKLTNRVIQHQFLDRLAAMLPAECQPIIIAEAGDDEGAMNEALIRLVQTRTFEILRELEDEGAEHDLAKIGRMVAELARASVTQKRWAESARAKIAAKLDALGGDKPDAVDAGTLARVKEAIYGIV